MPVLPLPATDELKLADWLERLALQSADRNASLGDLERALRRASVLEAPDDQRSQEAVSQKLLQVARELKDRSVAAGIGYPFTFEGSTLEWSRLEPRSVSYLFCLLLSIRVPELPKRAQTIPRRLFEDLSSLAAANYLGGKSLRFASPRSELPRNFDKAVTVLCSRLGEGQRYRNQPALHSKDAALDVVAWKQFPDGLPGKVVLFGQCASGNDWRVKLGALHPRSFCDQWMLEPPPSELLRGFFIPHRVSYDRWDRITRDGGLIFDRCRIAYWTSPEHGGDPLPQVAAWVEEALQAEAPNEAAA